MRYDGDWWQPARYGRYDRGIRAPREREPYGRGGYDRQDFGPYADAVFQSGFEPAGLQGPARYGLGPYHERLRRRRRSDDELRQEVEEALFFDTWVDSEAITVEVNDGVVTLRGDLPNYDEVRYATDDAWDIDGVVGVRAELRVVDR